MMNFLLPLLLVLASTNVNSQTSLNHGFKSVTEVQGITSWQNNSFVMLRANSREKLEKVEHVVAFDSSGNLIDQIRIDLNSFILASSASHDEVRILLKDDEHSRSLHLIQFKNNKFVRSTPITLQEDHHLVSCLDTKEKSLP